MSQDRVKVNWPQVNYCRVRWQRIEWLFWLTLGSLLSLLSKAPEDILESGEVSLRLLSSRKLVQLE